MWLHSLKVAQLLRSAACLHTNQSRSYLNHLVYRDNDYDDDYDYDYHDNDGDDDDDDNSISVKTFHQLASELGESNGTRPQYFALSEGIEILICKNCLINIRRYDEPLVPHAEQLMLNSMILIINIKHSSKENLPGNRTVILNSTEQIPLKLQIFLEVLSIQHLRTLH